MAIDESKLQNYVTSLDAPLGPEEDYRQSMVEAVGQSADEAAKAIPVARQNGIPIDMAERNMQFLQRDAALKSVLSKNVMKQIPTLGGWLRDRENARIAWDDVDSLTKLADLTVRAPVGGMISGTGSAIGAVGTVLEGEEALYGRAGYSTEIGKWLRANVAKPMKEYGSSFVPEERKTFGTETTGVVGQMVPMIVGGMLSGSAKVAAAIGAGQNADQMAEQAEIEGATAREKFFSSVAAGAVTGLTEYGPIGLIMGKFPWVKKMIDKAPTALQNKWAQRAMDIGVAGSVEAAQEFVENIMNNTIEHNVFNPDQEIMEDVYHQAALGGTAGMVARGIIMAVGGNLRSEQQNIDQRKMAAESRIATDSKLRARSPEKFKEAIQAIRGDQDYYIPMEKGVEFFQSISDKDAETLQSQFPDLKRKIADAANTGSDIMISQAEYLAYLAPLDTKQILSGVLKAHQQMDVLETFPDLQTVLPKEGADQVGDDLQARLEKEARAAGRGRGEAELYATAARSAYSNLVERADKNEEFMRIVEQRLGAGLSVGQKLETKIEKGDIDKILNAWRARSKEVAAKPTTRMKGDKEVVIRGRGKRASVPIIDYLSKMGVVSGSDLARELSAAGVTEKTHKKLFRKAGATGPNLFGLSSPGQGRKAAFDALPVSELNDYLETYGLVAPDDGTGHADPEWIMEQIKAEAAGAGAVDVETAARDAQEEDLSRFLEYLGVDPMTATNAEIKKAIDDHNKGKAYEAGGRTFYQANYGFISAVEDAADNISQAKGTGEQMLNIIRNTPGVKAEEIEWMGLDTFLKGKKSVTKQEIQDFIAQNKVTIEEVTLGKHDNKNAPYTVRHDTENNMYGVMDNNGEVVDFFDREGAADDFAESLNAGTEDEQGRTTFGTKFSKYTLPGGENYREVLLTLPVPDTADNLTSRINQEETDYAGKEMRDIVKPSGHVVATIPADQVADYIRNENKQGRGSVSTFRSSHYDQANILAHVRLNDRTDADGKKVLFVEEIQSDWHQKGRKQGYKKEGDATIGGKTALEWEDVAVKLFGDSDRKDEWQKAVDNRNELNKRGRSGDAVPDAPLKKTWHETAFRRVVQMAAAQGYDRVAWTTGEQQNERYDLSKQVEKIAVPMVNEGSRSVRIDGLDGKSFKLMVDNNGIVDSSYSGAQFSGKPLDEVVGKDMADKIMKLEEPAEFSGNGLKVGGEGMKGFYDKILPTYAKKFGKKFDAKVGDTSIDAGKRLEGQQETMAGRPIGIKETNNGMLTLEMEGTDIGWGMWSPNDRAFAEKTLERLQKEYDAAAPAKVHSIEISPEMKESVTKGVTLFQGERGSVTYTPSGRTIIELFRDADKSTLLHETGHIFLDILRAGSAVANAPESIVGDYGKVRKWFAENYKAVHEEARGYNPYQVIANSSGYYSVVAGGQEAGVFNTKKDAKARAEELHKGDKAQLEARGGEEYVKKFLDGDQSNPDTVDQMILTAMDEQFARSFEAYLYEGKAPSVGMQSMFRKFRAWLVNIYKSIKNLRVNINDDLRGVFDRILASNEAIEEVRSLKVSRVDPNVLEMMSKNQQEAYKRQQNEVFEAARDKTIRRALRDADREVKQWWKDETTSIEADLREKYENDPVYTAIRFLRTGEGIEGLEPFKINRDQMAQQYPTAMARFPDGVFSKTGIDIDVAAVSLGFQDVDSFVTALSDVPDMEARIAKEARAEMNSRHGDVFLDGRLEEVAVGNVLSHEASELIEMEMKAAGAKLGAEFPAGRDFKAAAARSLETMAVKDARKPNRFLLSTIRMAKKGAAALAKKNYEDYAAAKRKELFSINMYRQTRDFVEFHNKADDYYAKMMARPKARTKPAIEPEYHRMIWRVLANFMPSREEAISAAQLQSWLDEQLTSEFDTPPYIEPEAAQAMKKANFQSMSVAEFRAVHDLIKSLEARGRADQAIIVDGQRRDRAELITQMVEQLDKNLPDIITDRQSQGGPMKAIEGYLAIQTAASTYFEIADGGDQVGIFDMALKKGIDDGQTREAARNTKAAEDIAAIFNTYYTKKELMEMSGDPANMTLYKKDLVNGIWMSKMERLSGLLNMGNAGNEEAFLMGQRWKLPAEKEAFLATFDERDFKFAQAIWDYVDSFWPEVAELEMRRYGHPPVKVEAKPLDTPFGEFRGGYYPISGDPSKSVRVREFNLQSEMKGFVGYASTATSRSHTIERVGANPFDPMPLNLNFSVLTKHVSRVIHDIEMGEAIAQTAKIVRDTRFKNAFEAKFGIKAYQQIDLWLKDVAAGNIMSYDAISSTITWARRNMTVAVMGLSATTILSQVSGVTNSVLGLARNVNTPKGKSSLIDGAKWLGVGYKRQMQEMTSGMKSYSAFMDALHAKSPFMRDRASTIMRDVREVNETWTANPVDTNKLRRAMMYPIGAMQKQAVDTATWLGAYEKFMFETDEKNPEKKESKAIRYADNVVRDYQSSGLMQDLSGILRGTTSPGVRQNALYKLYTFAFNYFNNKLNRVMVHSRLADFSTGRGRYEFARDMIFLVWMDALIADIVLNRLPDMLGDDDDKDKFTEGWGWWLIQQPASALPLVRDAMSAVKMPQGGGDSLDKVLSSVGNLANQIGQGDADKALLKSFVSASGAVTGLVPSVQINRIIDLVDRASDGKDIEYKDIVRTRRRDEK